MSTLKARFEPPSGLKGLVHGPRLRMVFDEDEGEDEEASAEECDCYHEEEEKEKEEEEEEEKEEEEDVEEQRCDSKITVPQTCYSGGDIPRTRRGDRKQHQSQTRIDDPTAWYYEAQWSKYEARRVGSGGAGNEDPENLFFSGKVETSGFEREAILESRNLEILEMMSFDPEPIPHDGSGTTEATTSTQQEEMKALRSESEEEKPANPGVLGEKSDKNVENAETEATDGDDVT